MKRTSPIQIDWTPDRHSPAPVVQQIVQFIRGKIACGAWPVGTRLPSQRALAAQLDVNRSTVAAALDELASYGILAGRHGAGTYVSSNTWSLLLPPAPDWERLLAAGSFRENSRTIQAINRLEFDPRITRLGTGELDPRLFPSALWQDALRRVSRRVSSLGYLEPLGLPELREALAAQLAEQGIPAAPSCILITSGALQALQLISVCLLPGGATVLTEAPSYLQSLQVFQSAGMRLSGVEMDACGLRCDRLAARLKPGRGASILYTIPTNQNPTGVTMPDSRRRELLDLCVQSRLPVIEDGAYQELCFGAPPRPLKALDTTGTVIHLGSASKTLAPGLRVGWVVAAEPIVQRLADVKMQMDYGASSLSQWALTEFLSGGGYGAYLDGLRAELRRRRDSALAALEQHFSDLARWNTPGGGFYIWLTLERPVPLEKLFARAVQAGILLNPGDLYEFGRSSSLRLSYAYTDCGEFARAAARLAQLVRELTRETERPGSPLPG